MLAGKLINLATRKTMALSKGRAFSNDSGDTTPITADTRWDSVYDDNLDPLINDGRPRRVGDGDTIRLQGTRGDGTLVDLTFKVEYTRELDLRPGTVRDLLDDLEGAFACQATIDGAGRLVLTDWTADSATSRSQLAVNSISYLSAWYWGGDGHDLFGTSSFDYIPSHIDIEDGSQQGDVVTTLFNPEALSTTQKASPSTTIYRNFYGL